MFVVNTYQVCTYIYIHKAGSMCLLPIIMFASPQLVIMRFLKCLSIRFRFVLLIELVIFPLIIRVCSGGVSLHISFGCVACLYFSKLLLLGWNIVLCQLGMHNMHLLENQREVLFALHELKQLFPIWKTSFVSTYLQWQVKVEDQRYQEPLSLFSFGHLWLNHHSTFFLAFVHIWDHL